MSDLIRREDAMRVIKDDWDASFSREDVERAEICKFHFIEISNIPTAEPKVGKWLDGERVGYNGIYYYRYCSECLFERNDDDAEKDTPYCPNCGAKMERSE